ncbi:DUF1659 domain-containing protein [Desulforamulus aquiferis]|uniref:DUF1659 domain-containing protein n=1 Tax=Desulforamulus aquiferis TaxID=1397668 RepID=A0AAW7ZEY6_9FIRM|nr:DUF1659 domain-containing protein [Desulforamulus aquiferis]MDO7787951.1 DUF1659 domain-containing protein [Desulforamulus aquiferis]RYD07084.1 hypothetical protein N752_00445 [Desulforamulus aquiferis]
MPISKEPYLCTLRLRYNNGVNGSGQPVFVNRSFSKVKVTASDSDLYDAAMALNGLQSKVLVAVFRVDESELVEE